MSAVVLGGTWQQMGALRSVWMRCQRQQMLRLSNFQRKSLGILGGTWRRLQALISSVIFQVVAANAEVLTIGRRIVSLRCVQLDPAVAAETPMKWNASNAKLGLRGGCVRGFVTLVGHKCEIAGTTALLLKLVCARPCEPVRTIELDGLRQIKLACTASFS